MGELCYSCMRELETFAARCPICGHEPRPASKPHQLAPGTLLQGRYLLGRVLGQGGFGITYIGLDTLLRNRVAVKEFYPVGYANRLAEASPTVAFGSGKSAEAIAKSKERFLNEARVLAQLDGTRGVVGVKNFFEANATAYLVMEYLEGEDLQSYLQHAVLDADEVFARFEPIMDALAAVHSRGIIHRDISPENIKVMDDGSLRLMDFGAARIVELDGTRSVSVMLKVGYAPEEQYRPKGRLGPWTDVYALCATMYKCITGVTPDDSLQRIESANDGRSDPVTWPSELGIEIGERQEAALRRGMALRARDRFQNIGEMQASLHGESADIGEDARNNIATDAADAGSLTFIPEEPSLRRRSTKKRVAAVAGVVVAAAALCAGGAAFALQGDGQQQAVAHVRPTVTASAYEGTYDGKAHAARVAADDGTGVIVYYSKQPIAFDGYQDALANGSASTKPVTRTNAGTSSVYYLAVHDPEGHAGPSAEDCTAGSTSIRISKATQRVKLAKKSYSKTTVSASFKLGARAKGKLSYRSSRPGVATVSKTGVVSVTGPGTAKITVKAASTANYKSTSAGVRIKVAAAQVAPAQTESTTEEGTDTETAPSGGTSGGTADSASGSSGGGAASGRSSSNRNSTTAPEDSVEIDGWV